MIGRSWDVTSWRHIAGEIVEVRSVGVRGRDRRARSASCYGTASVSTGAALAAACGLAGDLVEGTKRDAHVKDTSRAIPGHGGALDRFDSVLFTTPLLYYVLRFLVW
jgi:CDP-diglyceride synthetase